MPVPCTSQSMQILDYASCNCGAWRDDLISPFVDAQNLNRTKTHIKNRW